MIGFENVAAPDAYADPGASTPADARAAPALTPQQQDAGLALLRDPQLIARIVCDVETTGVVGEASNALVAYLACVSRKLDKPLAVLIQSTSAAGKSTLMDAEVLKAADWRCQGYSVSD